MTYNLYQSRNLSSSNVCTFYKDSLLNKCVEVVRYASKNVSVIVGVNDKGKMCEIECFWTPGEPPYTEFGLCRRLYDVEKYKEYPIDRPILATADNKEDLIQWVLEHVNISNIL